MAKGERKEGGEPLASGKHCSGNENCSSCQYPHNPDRRPARLEFLVTYVDSHFGISRAHAKNADLLCFFLSLPAAGRGPPETAIGARRQRESSKPDLCRARTRVART